MGNPPSSSKNNQVLLQTLLLFFSCSQRQHKLQKCFKICTFMLHHMGGINLSNQKSIFEALLV